MDRSVIFGAPTSSMPRELAKKNVVPVSCRPMVLSLPWWIASMSA